MHYIGFQTQEFSATENILVIWVDNRNYIIFVSPSLILFLQYKPLSTISVPNCAVCYMKYYS